MGAIKLPTTSLLLVLFGVLACALPKSDQAGLALHRGVLDGQAIWQLWTGHLVHFGASHAAVDLLTVLLAGLIVEPVLGRGRTFALCLLATPLISIATLWLAPAMVEYRGASALAMMLGFAAGGVLWRDERLRLPVQLIAGSFAVKLAFDAAGSRSDLSGMPIEVLVAWQAHAMGALIGLLVALAIANPVRRATSNLRA
ncbi:rhomboid family intramembrane serine protease [Niveibacterium sp. 24ML]|uniref:rhomboid family intramembrane serine protease n=1 Tax=Niveibacterium sp. 24ML TaxID=2985512 RepID=UPI002270260A|nr:rhomboid family intramembrane serine protease [Niveibacterium sp. 24ML]MCX9158294.1 rhomboid family intramembrane serine protease [Niveibacterium sp. 24ML]